MTKLMATDRSLVFQNTTFVQISLTPLHVVSTWVPILSACLAGTESMPRERSLPTPIFCSARKQDLGARVGYPSTSKAEI